MDTYFLHFHKDEEDIGASFKALELKENLGKKKDFLEHLKQQFD